MPYPTKPDLERHLATEISTELDGYITALISACADYVERKCGNGVVIRREFQASDNIETRFFDYKGGDIIVIDDLRELNSLSLTDSQLEEDNDFILYPLNETVKEYAMLYQGIAVNSRMTMMRKNRHKIAERKAVKVIGKFGYSTTPPEIINLAVLTLAGSVIRASASDSSVAQVTKQSLGSHSIHYGSLDKNAQSFGVDFMLQPYLRESKASKTATIVL